VLGLIRKSSESKEKQWATLCPDNSDQIFPIRELSQKLPGEKFNTWKQGGLDK
jgi:hypothetical protein